MVLRIVGVARSTYYAHRHPKRPKSPRKGGRPKPGYSWTTAGKRVPDEQIQEWLCELIAGEEACYGYRKLTVVLRRRYGLIINHKKVYRLCRELRLLRPCQRRLEIDPLRAGLELTHPRESSPTVRSTKGRRTPVTVSPLSPPLWMVALCRRCRPASFPVAGSFHPGC
ncbi:MAG: transposase [Limnochordales bacterium]|nr:transposase [Limnochordales bacterium]